MCVHVCVCVCMCFVHVCVHQYLTSVGCYIAEDSSPENKNRDGHQRNELAILKYLGVASNGLKFIQDLIVCVCVCMCVWVWVCGCVGVCACTCVCAPIVGECCWLYSGRLILRMKAKLATNKMNDHYENILCFV